LKLFLLTHFACIFNVFFNVKVGDLQLMLLVSVYVSNSVLWHDDDPSLGSKLAAI